MYSSRLVKVPDILFLMLSLYNSRLARNYVVITQSWFSILSNPQNIVVHSMKNRYDYKHNILLCTLFINYMLLILIVMYGNGNQIPGRQNAKVWYCQLHSLISGSCSSVENIKEPGNKAKIIKLRTKGFWMVHTYMFHHFVGLDLEKTEESSSPSILTAAVSSIVAAFLVISVLTFVDGFVCGHYFEWKYNIFFTKSSGASLWGC